MRNTHSSTAIEGNPLTFEQSAQWKKAAKYLLLLPARNGTAGFASTADFFISNNHLSNFIVSHQRDEKAGQLYGGGGKFKDTTNPAQTGLAVSFLLEFSTAAKSLAFRFSSRAPVATRTKANEHYELDTIGQNQRENLRHLSLDTSLPCRETPHVKIA
jgi:hypothetical protein